MARTNRIKSNGDAYYHVMSRTNDKRFLFEGSDVKAKLVDAIQRTAGFSGVRLVAYAVMDNHFHAIVKVEKPEHPVGADELLRREGVLKGERAKESLAARWNRLAAVGDMATLDADQERRRARMHDVSAFVKTFKEEFDRAFKRDCEYCGSIWSGRFNSTIIEDGEYLARCKKYIVYNPVRAGIVSVAKDYQWSWCEDDAPYAAGAYAAGTDPVECAAGTDPGGGAAGSGDVAGDSSIAAGRAGAGGWWLRRVAQMGAGKVFGSAAFVRRTAVALGSRFRAKSVATRPVGEIGFATHGWRLAQMAA